MVTGTKIAEIETAQGKRSLPAEIVRINIASSSCN